MTFFDSLKKWFYTQNSSAASSDARVPLLDASGNPKGSDTMANLASVLGALTSKGSAGDDWNNIKQNGLYKVSNANTATNAPADAYQCGTLAVLTTNVVGGAHGVVQLYFENAENGKIWQRNSYILNGTFQSWEEITFNMPTFYKDYASLSELSTGLKVIPYSPQTSRVTVDFNNYTETGLYRYNSWEQDIDNKPFSTKSVGLLLVVSYMGTSGPIYGKKAMQKVLYDNSTGAHTMIRFKNSDDTWDAWFAWT